MNKNLQSPTKLTEFAPLQAEEKQDTVGQLFSRFFKFGKSTSRNDTTASTSENADNLSQESLPSWAIEKHPEASDNVSVVYDVDVAEGRSLPSVLKRISNLLALKSNNYSAYSDSELKQYWMPDSVSKECYECCEKFTTFRRRHHCRVCGQIFCSSCCNQQIPGKIFGCTGDLRVCTYCCKVVLSYLQSNDIGSDLSSDLRALQENLQSKYGDSSGVSSPNQNSLSPNNSSSDVTSEKTGTIKRKISVGYQEEKFASGRGNNTSYLTSEEKCRALQNSASLRNLYEEICRPNGGIALRKQRYRLRNYVNTFLGSELVDWLIYQQKANTRVQAAAFCQALLDGGYIICLSESVSFIDGNSLYKLGMVSSPELPANAQNLEASIQDEPMWVQSIPQDSNNTDSEGEQTSPSSSQIPGHLTSSSSYTLDLNIGASTVYLSKPPVSTTNLHQEYETDERTKPATNEIIIRTSEQREFVPESGWHKVGQLREENGEFAAYKLLTNAFEQHENTLIKQLLSVTGLSLTWSNILGPLIHEIVDAIRPDVNHNAEELDIRHYVQFKKLTGGLRSDCSLIRGIVSTKNVAHKSMSIRLENPKILLLECPIVYQRTEGRLMSLDPVLMQEQQYLTHVADRILALKPDIVLVQRNMSRLAQDILREKGVTIVLNVKQRVLERIARCTDGDLVSSIDARISAPRLGTCKHFYLKSFDIDKGGCKTLMFFEGLPQAHLGCTVLLRGASKLELQELKSVASFLLFACYNWRLEKSFLMDEFAYPRCSKDEFFDDSKENSPVTPVADVSVEDLSKQRRRILASNEFFSDSENDTEFFNSAKPELKNRTQLENDSKKSLTEPIQDFSDPLHSYNVDDVFKETQKLSVADLPCSNQFRKALDDTILCISPFLVFSVPYLETENGRKCKLRHYYPPQIYHSQQFGNNKKKKISKEQEVLNNRKNEKNMKPPHKFVTTPISASIDSNEVQGLLAHYRACGGRLIKKSLLDVTPVDENEGNKERDPEVSLDVLNPRNHQRMAVLFCSFSKESINAPAFCVNPWVVYMAFYGQNDIPLGCFLMRYCFSPKYHCQSKCETPMLKHVRRFVHYTGCVSITLNHLDTLSQEEDIIMWSWCSKCQRVSPMVKMSVDTWSFSFAKYLELRFHGGLYSRRGNSDCQHSLHHDHYQYFTYKNTVASFKYTSVDLWEISLPPRLIKINYNIDKQQNDLIDEIKTLALKGHDVYSNIQEKLSLLPNDDDIVQTYKQLLLKENQIFKQKIEEIQLKLTSPTIENKFFADNDDNSTMQVAVWKIQDGIVRIKRIIVEAVDQWNTKLSESVAHKKEDKKKDKTSSQELETQTSTTSSVVDTSGLEASVDEQLKEDSTNMKISAKKNRSLDKPDEEVLSSSPRGHHRSQSDGTVLNQIEDVPDRKESDKKTVKTIFSIFSSSQFTPIANPFNNQDHFTLPSGVYAPFVVYESEPSSMVAYALNSTEYKKQFDELTFKKPQEQTPSPVNKRRSNSDKDKSENDLTQSIEKSSIKSFFRTKDSKTDLLASTMTNTEGNQQVVDAPSAEKPDDRKNHKIEVQFEDPCCKFLCIIYLAEKFAALRNKILPIGEEGYIRSLSRCVQWNARGGKSGSTFAKTVDDRFIIKGMPQKEIQLFLESAHNYFAYMNKCLTTGQPTLLGKIVGIYQIVYRNNTTNATSRTYLLVMENLFYNRVVEQKFDLKGSMRNRLVNTDNQDGEIVLLDENLLKMTCENPLYIHPHSKEVLTSAILSDTEFLSNQCVMDYSLLVGLDSERKELVLGIIDYIRTFTWDKKLETIVKKTGILGGQGKLPTIMPPQEYQKRFIEAMHRYFLEVPDPWIGLGSGLET